MTAGLVRAAPPGQRGLSREQALRLVAQALAQIQFGEITVKVEAGKPVFVDKFERQRIG